MVATYLEYEDADNCAITAHRTCTHRLEHAGFQEELLQPLSQGAAAVRRLADCSTSPANCPPNSVSSKSYMHVESSHLTYFVGVSLA